MDERDLAVMATIQAEKERDIEATELLPLNAEGVNLAAGKRFTIDIIDAPSDPLR